MNYKRTPPIQWLPIFEAAARLLSFKRAAEELHVSPPAISQQIKALENFLNMRLFERQARQLRLTPEGEFYLEVARSVLEQHTRGYLELQRRYKRRTLTISTPLFLAQELLIPNYLSFSEYAADTELRIETRTSMVDFEHEAVDAAIRFGEGSWPGLECRKLCACSIAVVCSPNYAKAHAPISAANLSQHRLISLNPLLHDWENALDQPLNLNQPRIICDSYMAVLKSAAEGLGLALGIFPVTGLWTGKDRLVEVLPAQYSDEIAYWLVSPQRDEPLQSIEALNLWAESLFAGLKPAKP